MSNSIIPHLLSDSPPPISGNIEEDYDDEFGDFTGPGDLSFDNENSSTSSTPKKSKQNSPAFEQKPSSCQLNSVDESVVNNMKNELPSKNFINILDHIENNVPKIENLDVDELEKINFENEIILLSEDSHSIKETHNCSETLEPHLDLEKGVNECNGLRNRSEENSVCGDLHERISKIAEKVESLMAEDKVEIHSTNGLSHDADHNIKDYNDNSINKLRINSGKLFNELSIIDQIDEMKMSSNDEIEISDSKQDMYNNDWNFGDCNHETIAKKQELGVSCQSNTPDNSKEVFAELDSKILQSNGSYSFDLPHVTETVNDFNSDDFNEFADFTSFQNPKTDEQEPIPINDNEDMDEFADFANHSSFNQMENDKNDDFDDFSSYSTFVKNGTAEEIKEVTCKSPKDALEKSKILLEKVFPHQELDVDDYLQCDFTTENSVFQQLKDVTETNAVSYQWEKSTARKNLLKTLNIDIRNILYGPSWNAGVPIFAANLGSAPLEPIKTDLPLQTPLIRENQTPPDSSSNVVPMAEFDWNSSGLTNPLSSFKSGNTGATNEEPESSPVNEFDDLRNIPVFTDTNLSEECIGNQKVDDCHVEDDFSDFASYQPSTEAAPEWTGTILPLRESHISFQPSNNSDENSKTKANENRTYHNLDLDLLETKNVNKIPIQLDDFKELEFFETEETELDLNQRQTSLEIVKENDSDEVSLAQSGSAGSFDIPDLVAEPEDEFSDFHSSMPPQSEVTEQPLSLPVLQPSVLQPIPVNNQPVTRIEWPEPGLDEEEVNRIVMGCLSKTANVEKPVEKIESKQNNADDDEWSDFVSVKGSVKSRTSTPDLPLSVFNLGNIQPVKAPTPLITPNGLVCSPVKTQPPDTKSKTMRDHKHHPFITSQAFEALNSRNNASFNSFDGASTSIQPNKYGIKQYENYQSSNSSASLRNNTDDDDWGEFVSAKNVPLTVNNLNSMQSSKHIFTNPSLNLVALNKKTQQYPLNSRSTVIRQEKRNIPTISALPDLDFVSPKTRSTRK